MKCRQCEAQADPDASLAWYAVPFFLVLGILPRISGLCRDCAGGQNFLALLAWAALLAVCFVVAVILL